MSKGYSKRIAFFLNSVKEDIDYRKVEGANPGIGGTQFLFWTTSYFLQKKHEDIEVILFSKGKADFPDGLKIEIAIDEIECIKLCKKLCVDYLVLRGPFISSEVCSAIDKYEQNVIVWSHNLENHPAIKNIGRSRHIVKNVCVSNEQLVWLKDTKIYDKSTFIYNGICFDEFNIPKKNNSNPQICYIGNLYPRSGIETVISAWPKIEEAFPMAELWIIGGNNLYDEKFMKSAYSKRSFEILKRKMDHTFKDDKGNLNPRIHFTGVLGGKQKLELMSFADVGIANITMAGDTFGLAAVEFQALGVPVVSVNKYGVMETVNSKETGILVKNRNHLAEAVCYLLKDKQIRNTMSENSKGFVRAKFDIANIVDQWYELILNINSYIPMQIPYAERNYSGKVLLTINKRLKEILFFRWLPSVLFYRYLKYGMRRVFEKFNLI